MQHPDVPAAEPTGDGGYLDVLILRELAHHDGMRHPQVAATIGVDLPIIRAACERLEAEAMIHRFMGLRITVRARDAYGTALWRCTGCGCVDEAACERGCVWVERDRCSACFPPLAGNALAAVLTEAQA